MKDVQVGARKKYFSVSPLIDNVLSFVQKKLSVLSLTESVPCGVLDQICLACLFSPNLLLIIIMRDSDDRTKEYLICNLPIYSRIIKRNKILK
jgi:hypothetical protein